MSLRTLALSLLLGLALSPATWSSEHVSADSAPPAEGTGRFLDSITVTATRSAREIDQVPGTVSVIGRRQIEAQVMTDIGDLVRYEPGVYVESSASPSGIGGFSIRGIGGNRVQTRIDGVPIAEQFEFGHFEVAPYSLSLELVERVEILRGAASSLYGSDALGGVVSLVTRDPSDLLAGDDSFFGFRSGWDGRDRRFSQTLTWAGERDAWQGLAMIEHARGHERDNRGDLDTIGDLRSAPDPRDRRSLGLLAKLVHRGARSIETKLTLEALGRQAHTEVLSSLGTTDLGAIFGFPPAITYLVDKPAVDADDDQRRLRIGLVQSWTATVADQLLWRVHAQSNRTEQTTNEIRITTRGGGPFGEATTLEARRQGLMRFEHDSVGGEIQGKRVFGAHLLTFGTTASLDRFDQLRDRPETDLATGEPVPSSDGLIFPTKYFPESEVLEAGLYAQAELDFLDGRLRLTPGLRYDRFDLGIDPQDPIYLSGNLGTEAPVELREDALSPKLGLVATLGKALTVHALYAHGFRAPPYSAVNSGFTHLAGGQTRLPNPDLRPEESDGFEVGMRRSGRRASLGVTAFSNEYRDFIELIVLGRNPATGLTEFQQQNVTRARISGLEASAQLELGRQWQLRTAAAWIEGKDRLRSTPLNSIHPPQLVLGIARESKNAGWRMEAVGRLVRAKRLSDLDRRRFPQFAAPSFQVLDLFTGRRLTESLSLDAGISNLFDATYWSWAEAHGLDENSSSLKRYTESGRAAAVSLRYRR